MAYDWPGNVRELENVIERAVVLSSEDEITSKDLGIQEIKTDTIKHKSLKDSIRFTSAQMEKEAIIKTLKETKGNRTKAAKILGISRRSLLNKIKLYKLENLK